MYFILPLFGSIVDLYIYFISPHRVHHSSYDLYLYIDRLSRSIADEEVKTRTHTHALTSNFARHHNGHLFSLIDLFFFKFFFEFNISLAFIGRYRDREAEREGKSLLFSFKVVRNRNFCSFWRFVKLFTKIRITFKNQNDKETH